MSNDQILLLPATELTSLVARREISAAELTKLSLDRIAEMDGELGAFTVVLTERAHQTARLVDERIANGEILPLAGLPLAVKDHIWLAGAPATNGSRSLADFIPNEDAIAVSRLIEAGAVVVGKTNNPEFCYRGDCDSPMYGLTRNPWDLNRTPGGSSGGSAVAVATGMAALAIGTDGGGSIRIPASFCGVAGHKPTYGLVPTQPGFRGWPTLSVFGPLARTVPDLALMLKVIAGPHSADPSTVVQPQLFHSAPIAPLEDLKGLRIAVSEDFGFATVDPNVRTAFRSAVSLLAELGCELVSAHPVTQDPVPLWWTIASAESFASEAWLLDRSELIGEDSLRTMRRGEAISARDYLDAQRTRSEFSRVWGSFLESFDLIISPGEQVLPFLVGQPEPSHSGQEAEGGWWGMDSVANLTGQPATSVPTGFSEGGLPFGIQFMGRRFDDERLLRVAATFEALARGPLVQPQLGGTSAKNRQPLTQ
jgi:Asp-tRNA(Asn)/Glu-tRNA(Gln) amidotransferase A subunit family amidase